MPTPLQIPIKYCKSLEGPEYTAWTFMTATEASRFFHRALYEWWGFCVNGTNSLTVPGGLAAVSVPTGSLVAKGSDGTTSFGFDVFSSPGSNFITMMSGQVSGTLVGKYLVTWIPGSPDEQSTDDGVYFIKSVEDATHIRVDIHSAGTRRLGNHPFFWDRNNINWRIVDLYAATLMSGWGDGNYQVLTFQGAPTVNPGQAQSQVKITHHTSSAGNEGTVGLIFSPGGTWNGTNFTDGTIEQDVSFFNLSGSGATGQSTYTLIGGQDFIIAEVRGPSPQGSFTNGSGFHIEIPNRNYPEEIDPNPIAWVTWQNAVPSQVAATYYNGFNMVCQDTVVRTWKTLVRSPMGDRVRADYTGNAYGTGQWQQFQVPIYRFADVAFDRVGDALLHNDQYMTTDGILSLTGVPGQFSLARVRLRHVRFTVATLPRGSRIGDPITDPNGWVVVSNGVLWPWDDALMPEGPWRLGV